MIEIWKIIEYYSNYAVSNIGRVKRIIKSSKNSEVGRVLKFNTDVKGYSNVKLYKDSKSKIFKVHKLVLEAFVGKRKRGLECNHKDGKKNNNCVFNLEWVTPSENQKHSYRIGLSSPRDMKGEKNNMAKLEDEYIPVIRSLKGRGVSQKDIAKIFKVDPTTISDIIRGKCWSHIK